MKKLYFNGTIVTMEKDTYVEAVLEEDGVITAVGKKEDLELLAQDAEKVDLKGKTMLPAFIDAHSHFSAYANSLLQVPLEETVCFSEIVEKIQEFIKKNAVPEGKWVIAKGFDPDNMKEKGYPDCYLLDQAAPKHPVLVQHKSGHMGVMNTLALKRCGITEQTENPKGGKIGKKEGKLTGYLEENALIQSLNQVEMPTMEEMAHAFTEAQTRYASYGISTIQEGMTKDQMVPIYEMLSQGHKMKLDLVAYVDEKESSAFVKQFSDRIQKYVDHIKIGGYKIFLDGSPQGRTAWMRENYQGSSDYKGYPVMTDEEVYLAIRKAAKEKKQILAHCNGDAASDQYIRMCRKVKEEGFCLEAIRPVLVHGQLLGLDQLEDIKELSIVPSFFVAHVYHWGDVHVKNFGWEQASHISPVGSAIEKGLYYTFHQDSPVIEPDMLETIWCAVNRKTKAGITLGEEEKISVLDALRGVTIYAAYQYFEEEEKGSIREGKHADFVILDKNPLEVEPDAIRSIQVLQTIKDGKVIYSKMKEE